jgi:hypothetical protein
MQNNMLSDSMFDAATPQQFFDSLRRASPIEPEKALLLALLQDAVECYQKYSAAQDRVGREQFAEAERWLMGGQNDWIFSFNNVCDLLGLDPQYLRRGLRHWKANKERTTGSGRRKRFRRQAA